MSITGSARSFSGSAPAESPLPGANAMADGVVISAKRLMVAGGIAPSTITAMAPMRAQASTAR